MNSWSNLTKESESDYDNYMETLSEPPVPPKAPDIATKLVDVAEAVDAKSTYIPEEGAPKKMEENKEIGVAPPVDIYEPGFRSDIYEAMIKFFKEKRATRDRLDVLRKKMGMR